MYLTRHNTPDGPRWAANGRFLPADLQFSALLTLPASTLPALLFALEALGSAAEGALLAPIEHGAEVWGSGVTYLRSRDARKAESATADVYQKVYEAERPEIFFKAPGWRVSGPGVPVRIRKDTRWNVPEPETDAGHQHPQRDRRLHGGQRHVLTRHRRPEPALFAAGQDLRRLLRPRPRHPHHAARGDGGPNDRLAD